MHQAAAPAVHVGIIYWVWPNVAFWGIWLLILCAGIYARIPEFMEMDAETRRQYHSVEDQEDQR
ncbi:hypothetical protein [Acidihalobacter ferrooxydans]|nr:hypothetical protein [Acidihalobacter ferrooxydans]